MRDDPIEAAKRRSLGQRLLKTARRFDEIAFARIASRHPRVRRSHLALAPHIDLDGTRISTVAARAGITKQAVGQLARDMEAAGYLQRLPDPDDGRAKILVFTEQGRAAMLDGLQAFQAVEAELQTAVGAERLARLTADLEAVLAAIERLER